MEVFVHLAFTLAIVPACSNGVGVIQKLFFLLKQKMHDKFR